VLQQTAEQLEPYRSAWDGINVLWIALTVGGILLTAGAAFWRLRRQRSL
jgi:hypothetical protein